MPSSKIDPTLNLVSHAYGAAAEPERFENLLEAWDSWLDAIIVSTEAAFEEISPTFHDALSVADRLDESADALTRSALEITPAPAIVLNALQEVVAINSVAEVFFDRERPLVGELLKIAKRSTMGAGKNQRAVYRFGGGPGRRSYLAIEVPLSTAIAREYPDGDRLLLLSQVDWNSGFETDIATRLNLSAAELRVARGLLQGRTAQELAGDVGRSLPTIRSHIKMLLQKSGTRRQSELVQLLMIMRQVWETAERHKADPLPADDFEISNVSGDGGSLQIARYGSGYPVLYFTTSSRPEETEPIRAAFSKSGLKVLAPYRPGSGELPQTGKDATDELLDGWLGSLRKTCDDAPIIVGHREGGVVAAKAAARLLDHGHSVAGLVLISTGAPLPDFGRFHELPPTIRRSFLTAQYAPLALDLGYRTAARLFRSSSAGQDRIVQFFFCDSPMDEVKLTDRYFYDVTRDNIAYCFNNLGQIVRDIALWSSDWSPFLLRVAKDVPVLFVHGDGHTFFRTSEIADLCQHHANLDKLIIEKIGQLALYDQPEKVARAIAELVREPVA